MKRTIWGVVVFAFLSGCALYEGSDPGASPTLAGEWTLRIDLTDCWVTPAPVEAWFVLDDEGAIVTRGAFGASTVIDYGTYDFDDTVEPTAWVYARTTDDQVWEIEVRETGGESYALVSWMRGGCYVSDVYATVERVRY